MVVHYQYGEQLFPRVRDHGRRHGAGGCANSRAKADGSHVTTSLESVIAPDRQQTSVGGGPPEEVSWGERSPQAA